MRSWQRGRARDQAGPGQILSRADRDALGGAQDAQKKYPDELVARGVSLALERIGSMSSARPPVAAARPLSCVLRR